MIADPLIKWVILFIVNPQYVCTVFKCCKSVYIPYHTQANYLLLGAGEEAMDFLGKFMIFRICFLCVFVFFESSKSCFLTLCSLWLILFQRMHQMSIYMSAHCAHAAGFFYIGAQRLISRAFRAQPLPGAAPARGTDFSHSAGNLHHQRLRPHTHVSVNIPLSLHRKKRFSIFPSPAGISLTKLSLGGNNLYMTSLFLPRESLVSDIPAFLGTGISESFFYVVTDKRLQPVLEFLNNLQRLGTG